VPELFGQALRVVPFNDLSAVERVLADEDRVAGMILEPIMMNSGVIVPEEGYLAGLQELLHRHGALLTFDEVKTGVTIASGAPPVVGSTAGPRDPREGARRRDPDRRGRRDRGGDARRDGRDHGAGGDVQRQPPLDGGRASGARRDPHAGRVPAVRRARRVLAGGLAEAIERYRLPATVASVRCRGSVHFRSEPVRDFRDHAAANSQLEHLGWLYQLNGGVFQPAGDPWTFSVAHTEDDLRRSVENFEAFASAVAS
jgi:glutamate-1-semialdehyde 2,1-aminomutase